MPKDIALDSEFNIVIKNGDFLIDESAYQHQQALIFANKGEFKATPKVGVGAINFIENTNPEDFAREIRLQFIADGMSVKNLKIADNLEISVDAQFN